MTKRTITAEALGVVHKQGNVAMVKGASLKVPKNTHEVSGKVAVASNSMPEAEGDKRVFRARRTATTPR